MKVEELIEQGREYVKRLKNGLDKLEYDEDIRTALSLLIDDEVLFIIEGYGGSEIEEFKELIDV